MDHVINEYVKLTSASLNREYVGSYDDRYISPIDGKVEDLMVQAADDIYDSNANCTWGRTFIRNVAPWYLRLADWPMNHVDFVQNGGPIKRGM